MTIRSAQRAQQRQSPSNSLRAATCVALLCSVYGPVKAQVLDAAQQSAEATRQAQQREEALRQKLQIAPDVRLPAPPQNAKRLRLRSDESPCFVIERIDLALASPAPIALDPLRLALSGTRDDDPPLGRCLGTGGVGTLIERAQDALIASGYVTSRVVAAPQDLSRGVLQLQVLPGRIGAIHLLHPDDRATLINALPMRAGDVLNTRDVEQAMENLKRVPTAEADIQIEPSAQAGHSDLVVRWSQGLPWRLLLSADDSGDKASGKYQGSATLSYDNAFTLNDLLYVTASRDLGGGDAGNRGTRGVNAHYILPMGYWMLSLSGGHNRYFQSVTGATQDYLYSGRSHQQDIELRRLVHRDATGKTSAGIKAFARQSENRIDDTEIEVQRRRVGGYELGLQHQTQWGSAQIEMGLNFKRGTGAFGSTVAPEDAFGEGTNRFALWTANLQWRQPLEWAGQRWQYQGQWRGQSNRTPLTPQDRFAIGGRYTVRGFDGQSSLSAERGWLIRNEISTAISDNHQFFAGLDHGQVGGPSAQNLLGTRLTGMALGLRGSAAYLQYEIFAGWPLDQPEGFRTANTTYGVSVSAQF